ncbi:MAG: hypothetical protein HY289_05560 [Planctomycetes bacterium]|nr:hypothetical protein [Planctomycetota bacterium]
MRLSRQAVRIGIVAALVAPACLILLATVSRAQVRPPGPGGIPPIPPPPIPVNPPKFPGPPTNPGGPINPGIPPNNPGLPPNNPGGGKTFETVWTCGKCRKEVGRGIRPPATCPHCGVKLINGTDNTFLNGNPGANPPLGNPPVGNPPLGNPPLGNPPLAEPAVPVGNPGAVPAQPLVPIEPMAANMPIGNAPPALPGSLPPGRAEPAAPPERASKTPLIVLGVAIAVGCVFTLILCAVGVACLVIFKGKKAMLSP